MKNIKKELSTTNTRKAVDYIVTNYKVVILPLDIRRTYNHKKKVDKAILTDLQKNLIRTFYLNSTEHITQCTQQEEKLCNLKEQEIKKGLIN